MQQNYNPQKSRFILLDKNNKDKNTKINIIEIQDNWKYNNDSIEMFIGGKIFRLQKFRVIYGNINQFGDGCGIIYLKEYDESQNQKYTICEGQFQNYLLHGKGKIYNGKSKIVKIEGNFVNGEKVKQFNIQEVKDNNKQRSIIQESQIPQQIISKEQIQQGQYNSELESEGKNLIDQINLLINQFKNYNIADFQNSIIKVFKQMNEQLKQLFNQKEQSNYQQTKYTQESWVKYDSIFYPKDLYIVADNSQLWLNSSILDAYAVYLNKNDEENFWKSPNKEKYRRCLVIPSYITTNYFANQNYMENIYQYFLEYEKIDYKIGWVYKDICFMINCSNSHWLFAQVDLEFNTINIYDSLDYYEYYQYSRIVDKLNQILSSLYQEQITLQLRFPIYIPKQRNGYECGLYSCIYAKWVSEDKMQQEIGFQLNKNMRKILQKIISIN